MKVLSHRTLLLIMASFCSCSLHKAKIENARLIAEKLPNHNISYLPEKFILCDDYLYLANRDDKVIERLYIYRVYQQFSCLKVAVGDPYGSLGSVYVLRPDSNNIFKLYLSTFDIDCSYFPLDSNYALYNITFSDESKFMEY